MKPILIIFMGLFFFSASQVSSEEMKEVVIHEKLGDKEIAALLGEHNRVRSNAGVNPLEWSEELSSYAEKWANKLAENACTPKNRPESGKWKRKYGENLFMGAAGFLSTLYAVKSWENEKKQYRYGPIDKKALLSAGRYTQVIWKNTKHVGCAKAICSGNMVIVCNYDPPGNIIGEKPY